MAERAHSLPENVEGPFLVDSTCIDCDTCRQIAPSIFGETGEHSYVQLQPRNEEEARAAFRALVACPTASIGAADRHRAKEAVAEFPWPVAPRIWYCGFASRKSYGGSSYFIEHPDGNWLVDSPRYVERLARRLAEMGGLRYIFLSHRDDVADADRYAACFRATRFIHRLELSAQPQAERVIEGFDPQELAPDSSPSQLRDTPPATVPYYTTTDFCSPATTSGGAARAAASTPPAMSAGTTGGNKCNR